MEYLWESLDTPAWSAIPVGYSKKDLVLPAPVPTHAGNHHLVRLTTKFAGSTRNSTVDVTLISEGTDLIAKLKGPSGDFKNDKLIVLDASGSKDPDDPALALEPLSYAWECTRDDYPQPCFANSTRGEQQGAKWRIPAELLGVDKWHTFKVTVTKGTGADGRSSSTSIRIRPREAKQKIPTGRILRVCGRDECPPRHSTDAPLSLALRLDPGSESATFLWKSDQMSLTAPGAAPPTSRDLLLTPILLPGSGAASISVQLSMGNVSSTVSIQVPLNAKPQCTGTVDGVTSCLQITNNSDIFPGASFTASAVGFTDDGSLR